jgi:S-DNA-T family DNA segregation ATPase FtsK/SpoIIIE
LLLRLSSPEVAHILVAGTTGSGKTALARGMLTSLALANDPDEVRMLLVDPKGRGLGPFAGLPHLMAPLLREGEEAERRLRWLAEEMEWREQNGVSTPRVVVAVDEVADLVAGTTELGEVLTRLAARGREAGIHLLLCTQKPTTETVGGLLRANLPCRLVGRVMSAQEAVLAAGIKQTGAERLLGRGDFLLVAGGEVVRFQAAYVGLEEVAVMVEMLREELEGVKEEEEEVAPKKKGQVIPFPQRWVRRVIGALGVGS